MDELVAGDIIVASVRLKPPWGSLNAGGFDYQQWLLASGYNATGYIKYGQLESSQHSPKVAQWVRSVVTSAGLVEPAALMALALGDKGGVAPEDWRRLRNTGTVHLFIVSGLHVGLIGGWLYLFCLTSVRLFGWCLRKVVHGHRLAVMVSLLGVACYAWLSGLRPARAAGLIEGRNCSARGFDPATLCAFATAATGIYCVRGAAAPRDF